MSMPEQSGDSFDFCVLFRVYFTGKGAIAWPDKHVGFMTADQAEDKEKLENMGWKILNLLDAADMDTASLFGGDN